MFVWHFINAWQWAKAELGEGMWIKLKSYLHFLQGGRSILYFLANAVAEAWVSLLFSVSALGSVSGYKRKGCGGLWWSEKCNSNMGNCGTGWILTFTIAARSPSSIMQTAFRSPRAKASMAPMWAMNRSSGSVDSLRTLASKFRPPGCKPPCSTMVCEGHWGQWWWVWWKRTGSWLLWEKWMQKSGCSKTQRHEPKEEARGRAAFKYLNSDWAKRKSSSTFAGGKSNHFDTRSTQLYEKYVKKKKQMEMFASNKRHL